MSDKKTKTKVWGLSGGVGAGKSTAASYLRKKGFTVIDLDAIGRMILESDTSLHSQLRSIFGESAIKSGKPDRSWIRTQIFASPAQRKRLEVLLHPKILAEFEKLKQKAMERGQSLIFCEAALLIESGYHRSLDGLIIVNAPTTVRKTRLMERDQIADDLATKMLSAQTDDATRVKHASVVFDNSGDETALRQQIDRWLERQSHR